MKVLVLVLGVLLAGVGHVYAQAPKPADFDAIVLRNTAEILGIPVKDVRLNSALAKQVRAGDELDLIEIVMAIEEELGMEIPDEALTKKARAHDNLATKLTVRQLQEVVKELASKRRDRPAK